MEESPQKSFSSYGSVVSIKYFLIELCKSSPAARSIWLRTRGGRGSVGEAISAAVSGTETAALNSSSRLSPRPQEKWD